MDNKHYLSQEDYDKGISTMVRFCLDFAIIREGKILLSKRLIEPYQGYWHFPGGMVRKGESIQEAAERILKSELGLRPVSTEMVGYMELLNEEIPSKGFSTHSVSLVFKTELEPGEIRGSFQAKEITFFETVPDHTIEEVKEFLTKHLRDLR